MERFEMHYLHGLKRKLSLFSSAQLLGSCSDTEWNCVSKHLENCQRLCGALDQLRKVAHPFFPRGMQCCAARGCPHSPHQGSRPGSSQVSHPTQPMELQSGVGRTPAMLCRARGGYSCLLSPTSRPRISLSAQTATQRSRLGGFSLAGCCWSKPPNLWFFNNSWHLLYLKGHTQVPWLLF